MKRWISILMLLWLMIWAGAGVWSAANNPFSANALLMQGPDPTGNAGYPIAVVGATGGDPINAAQSGTWTVQPGNTANTTAWKVDGSAVTQPVSGTVTANQGTSPWVTGFNGVGQPVNCTQTTSPWVVSGTVTDTQGTSPWITRENDNTVTGTINANGQTVVLTNNGADCVFLFMTGNAVANFITEASPDNGTTWIGAEGITYPYGTLATPAFGPPAYPQQESFFLGGMSQFRLRCTAYTSGSTSVTLTASKGTFIQNVSRGTTLYTGLAGTADADGQSNTQSIPITSGSANIVFPNFPHLLNSAGSWDRARSVTGTTKGITLVGSRYSFSHLAALATTTVKSGAGTLHGVVINTLGVGDTVTLYDNTAGSGTIIAIINSAVSQETLIYDLAFATGLTAVIAGGTPPDVTITYN